MSSRWRRPDDVGLVDRGDHVFLAKLPAGPIITLDGVGAVVWREALNGSRDTLAARVGSACAANPDEVRADVDAFVGRLVDLGFLV